MEESLAHWIIAIWICALILGQLWLLYQVGLLKVRQDKNIRRIAKLSKMVERLNIMTGAGETWK